MFSKASEVESAKLPDGFDMSSRMSKEYWEAIAQCKKNFLEQGEDPRHNIYLRPEVAESWIRSRDLGLTPKTVWNINWLNETEFEKVCRKNRLLIEVADELLKNFMRLATSSGYTLGLFDPDGIFLAGSRLNLSNKPVISRIFNEKTVGTTGHGLAMLHKKPIQLIGPEEYLDVCHNIISYSAPILDENNEVLGALALRQDMGKEPWTQNLNNLQSHSLGWVSSLAIAIGGQVALYKINQNMRDINRNLRKTNKILEVTLEFIDEGIITIDPDGSIVRANREGNRILHLDPNAGENHNILNYLSNPLLLVEALNRRQNVNYIEELVRTKQGERPYLVSIRPVLKADSADLDVAVLRLNHPEKINALVTSRSGANAKFSFEDIIGTSKPMVSIKAMARRFASSPENILLLGESGTGKELFAQSIHNRYCPGGPFIAVNCAAMPRNLIESELFGYESGAFTGAEKKGRPGKIELASGGTLFLDEIGDMPYELQAIMLRVLQDKQVMRLGGKRYQRVDFRLIAATNQSLIQLVEEKRFREDLYFRLSVLTLEIPPLRERGKDIVELAEYFIEHYTRRMGWEAPAISSEVRNVIQEYHWPGNVRQLENAMIFGVNMADDKTIGLEDLPKEIAQKNRLSKANAADGRKGYPENPLDKDISMEDFEKLIIVNSLTRNKNNVAKAARILGISQSSIYRKMRQYNIEY